VELALAGRPILPRKRTELGPPPLLESEDPSSYDMLEQAVRRAFDPRDAVEDILVRDFIDLSWDVIRMRRMKAELYSIRIHHGLRDVLSPLVDHLHLERLITRWVRDKKGGSDGVTEALGAAGIGGSAVEAATFARHIDEFEKIDRLIAQAEFRRNSAKREFERHRNAHAETLTSAS
jgi:hypothetical protein